MFGLLWNRKQATSLVGLVACRVSCATSKGGLTPVSTLLDSPRGLVVWVYRPPAGCSVGSSGPTLNPRNAIWYARLAAVDAESKGRSAQSDGSR